MIFKRIFGWKYRVLFNPIITSIMYYLELRSFQNVDVVIVTRNDIQQYLTNSFHLNMRNIVVLPQGIDLKQFRPQTFHNRKVPTILFVGRLSAPKGIQILLSVARVINANFVFVAPSVSKSLAKKIDAYPNIEVLTNIRHARIQDIYNSADIFLMPSHSETGPLVTLEAMACGLPVVGSIEGCGDYVVDKVNGYIVGENVYENYIDPLNALVVDSALRLSFSRASIKQSKKFGSNLMVKKFSKIING
jgi:glycosyltransferase involved in cell wall biosynthesis